MKTRRLVVLVVLGLVAAGVVAVGRFATADVPQPAQPLDRLVPAMAAADAASQTWFCAAGSAQGAGGVAEQAAAITNTTTDIRNVTVTAFTDTGEQATRSLELAAQSRTTLRASDLVNATWASLLIEVDGGGVAVDHNLTGPYGGTGGPCASAASAIWHVPANSTLFGVRNLIALFNPFAERAVLDLVAETDEGRREPTEYSGLVVEPRSVRVVDLAEVITVRDQVALSISARAGLVVAEQLEVVTETAELPTSLAVSLAAPATQPAWYFPLGAPLLEGVTQRVVVYNPGDAIAEVDVQVLLGDPDVGFVEPFALSVRPGEYRVVDLGEEERVPTGTAVGAYVETRNDTSVVAARVVRSGTDAPAARSAGVVGPGASISIGLPLVATEWVVPVGATNAGGVRLGITNLGLRNAEVTVTVLRNGEAIADGGGSVTVDAGRRGEITLGEIAESGAVSVLVASTQPVAVERNVVYAAGGFVLAPAIAVADTASRPPVAVPDTSTSPTVVLDGITTTTTTEPPSEEEAPEEQAPEPSEEPAEATAVGSADGEPVGGGG